MNNPTDNLIDRKIAVNVPIGRPIQQLSARPAITELVARMKEMIDYLNAIIAQGPHTTVYYDPSLTGPIQPRNDDFRPEPDEEM